MTLGAKTKYALAVLLLMLLPFTQGCSLLGDALSRLSEAEATEQAAVLSPSPAPTAVYAAEDDNPVFTFYTGFFAALRGASGGLLEAAVSSDDENIRSLCLELLSDEAIVSEPYVTVGALPSGGDGIAAEGAFSGAYTGEGSIRKGTFTFTYASGRTLEGSYDGLGVDFTAREGGKSSHVRVEKSGEGYFVSVVRDGMTSLLELAPDSLRYARAESPVMSGAYAQSAIPEIPGVPVLSFEAGTPSVTE